MVFFLGLMAVILDIGAGGLSFAKDLVKNNKDKNLVVFCGEPNWMPSPRDYYNKILNQYNSNKFIESETKGIYRVNSKYDQFRFGDETLDMVTVNSPSPITPPDGIESELDRCLKPGGIFYYGHSTYIDLEMPKSFELVREGGYPDFSLRNWWNSFQFDISNDLKDYSCDVPTILTASPVLESNIIELNFRINNSDYKKSKGYIYDRIPLCPNYQVWVKK